MSAMEKMTLSPDGYRIRAMQLIVPTVFICLLSLALPMLTLQVYDRILPNPESGTLPVLMAGVCIAITLEVCLRLARAYTLSWSGAAYEHRMACQVIDHALQSDLAALARDGSGEHLNRVTAISKLRDFHNGYNLVTYTELAFVALYLGLMGYIAGPLVLVPVVILAVFTIVSVAYGKWLSHALAERDRADDKRYNFVIESLQGVHTIKSFTLEKPFLRRYEHHQYDATVSNYGVTEATASIFNTATIFAHIMLASVITCGAWLVLDGQMSSGALIASILLSGRVMQPVQRTLALWTRYQDYNIAQGRVMELADMPVISTDKNLDPRRAGALVVRGVGSGDLFHNVDLEVGIGQSVQITGGYGCGKTTLMKMMAGLYPAHEGTVSVDGCSPLEIDPQKLMTHIGYIPTQGTIFRGRIRDNLTRFGMMTEEEVRPVTAMLGIDQDVARLPRGFDTWMEGVDQDTIPPGLRQRIAIARVLAARPRIILFDNADRNLDRDGYRQVHTLLGRLRDKVALVMVTDDLNISRLAERRLILDHDGLRDLPPQDETAAIFKELRA